MFDTLRNLFSTPYRAMPYRDYLHTAHWQRKRAAAIQRAGNRCQFCNTAGRLEVHHRTYERLGRERDGDLVVLCRECHGVLHQYRRLAK